MAILLFDPALCPPINVEEIVLGPSWPWVPACAPATNRLNVDCNKK
jgi:hypothetical protein